ncbi:MAG TPA: T9SS type A sorting domain-containing protein, partial [Bacteroidia bacterium]|nr:T9SS type A sorting domain-containing protein [Bacteroidia bacterium]
VMTGKGVSGKHRDLWQYQPYVTGMEEFNSMSVNVYPNPASEIINFDLDGNFVASTDHLSIQLLNVEGKLISEQKVNGNTHVEMHNENWAAGIYMYSLTDGTKIYGGGRVVVR